MTHRTHEYDVAVTWTGNHGSGTSGYTAYEDAAHGVMRQHDDGSGEFDSVTLRPTVTISADSDPEVALQVHAQVPAMCFIARSVNFPVHHEPVVRFDGDA